MGVHSAQHGLRTPREEIAFTARPKIHSHSQIFRYGGSIFCLPHRPIFSEILDLCLHWVSVVRGTNYQKGKSKNLSKSGGDHYPQVPISPGVPAIEAMTEQRPPTGGC